MKLYFTEDSDGLKIKTNANIKFVEGEDRDLLLRFIKDALIWDGVDSEQVDVKEGEFGDAWIKHLHKYPGLDLITDLEREAGPISILKPGEHPGNKAWWITPKEPIYVLIYHIKED